MSENVRGLKQLLEKLLKNSSKVFIVGHKEADYDSIGSSIGLQALCQALGKEVYIVLDDPEIDMEPGVKKIVDEYSDMFNMISIDEYKKLKDEESLLIMTDVNKRHMIPFPEDIDSFKEILILDHHEEDQNTVNTPYHLIDPKISSASEIVGQLLHEFKIKYTKDVANFLLAGIFLDTKRFKKNTTQNTHDVARILIENGGDNDFVNDLFLEEFDADRKINDLVFNGTFFQHYQNMLFQNHNISFTLNREAPHTIYRKEEIAKASDKMLKYRIDAAFVMGFVKEGLISISARGKNQIDVGAIMSKMNGGGNAHSAGGRITSDNILEVEEQLMQIVAESIEQIDKNAQEQPLQKIKLPI